jgi:hypothetical protein
MWPKAIQVDLGPLCPADVVVARNPEHAKDWLAEYDLLAHSTAARLLRNTNGLVSSDVDRTALVLGPRLCRASRALWWLLAPASLRGAMKDAGFNFEGFPPTGVSDFLRCAYVCERTGWWIRDLPDTAPQPWKVVAAEWAPLYVLANRAETSPTDRTRTNAARNFAVKMSNLRAQYREGP